MVSDFIFSSVQECIFMYAQGQRVKYYRIAFALIPKSQNYTKILFFAAISLDIHTINRLVKTIILVFCGISVVGV